MKKIIVKVSEHKNSKYYPFWGRFTLNNVEYSLVFESIEELKRYFIYKYYPIEIVFKGVE